GRSGCTTWSPRSPIGSSSAIGAGRPDRATRATTSMRIRCPTCCGAAGCARSITGARTARRLKELNRTYRNLVEDSTRVMLRLKALFRARAIPTRGTAVYRSRDRGLWLAQLPERGGRFRAEALYAELDVLRTCAPSEGGDARGSEARSGVAPVTDDPVLGA